MKIGLTVYFDIIQTVIFKNAINVSFGSCFKIIFEGWKEGNVLFQVHYWYCKGCVCVCVYQYGFRYCYNTGRKEESALFNDTLNTFYLRLYGIGHMIKDHSDSERGNTLPPHRLLFPISSKAFVTPVVEHWLEREIAQWVHHE